MLDRIWIHSEKDTLSKRRDSHFLSVIWAISLLSFMADSGPKGKNLEQSLKISMGIQYLSFSIPT